VTLGGVVERFERENMFREECRQRGVEETKKMRVRGAMEREHVLMLQEDRWSEHRRRREEEDRQRNEDRYNEMMRIRQALQQVPLPLSSSPLTFLLSSCPHSSWHGTGNHL
jgi:hypothetical protein